jgi:hypothetical protein
MSIDIFSTHVLNRTVEYLDRPASFLLDTFFGQVQTEDAEEIHFDIDKSKPRLAPFVSPLVAGKVVANEGFETKSFKPAYVKDKRRFDPNAPLKRTLGERIGGSLTAQQRRDAALNRALRNQLDNLTRREEVMASEALRTGKVTVAGEDYPTVVVDFQRDAALSVTLTTGNKWGEAGVNVVNDLEDWAALVQDKSGAAGRTVVLDTKAWKLFKANDEVERLLDIRRITGESSLALGPVVFGQANEKARYVGSIGDFNIFVYNDVYVDDAGVSQKLLPDNTVLLGSTVQLEGTRCYGAIQDEKANYRAQRYFAKSWLEEDPALRWLLLQSAPLVVPYRPNASFCATVA